VWVDADRGDEKRFLINQSTVINLGDANGVITTLRIPADVMTYDLIIAALAAARAT
jgi:hypothetical protein